MSAPRRRRARRADLSQHFLRKGATAARLIDRTSITDDDLVLEIGAGRGALTLPLSRLANRVIAVEIDQQLEQALRGMVPGNVTVAHADFLLLSPPKEQYKIFGNLPYAQTTEIIRKLVESPHPPRDAWLVVQREAAHRFIGAPYRNETRWSLRLEPWWHIEIVDHLHRRDFDPPPAVESVMVWFARRARPLLTDEEGQAWLQMIEHCFQSGGSIRQVTRRWLTRTQMKRLARDLRFSTEARAPALTFEQWLGVFRFIRSSSAM